MRKRDELIGRPIFEAYPDNPQDETIHGVSTLRASLEQVRASRQLNAARQLRGALIVIDAKQSNTLPDLTCDIARPDGTFEERWWFPVNSAVLDDDVEALIHNANDVTEERRVEAALRDSEARLQTLTKNIPQLVWRSCGKGLLMWASPQWLDFHRANPGEESGLRVTRCCSSR
jgi:PAS domain-containing protein